jgi:hypothetical protein
VPEDAANFRIVTSALNLKIDNLSATGVTFADGRRLYRDDDASPLVSSTTGGGSITFFAGKVYTVNVGGSALTSAESAKLMSLPAAESTATAVRGELATELGRIDAPISSRMAAGTVNANLVSVQGQAIAGTGVEADPWGPAA